MLFHEIYGCYYQAIAKILSLAISGEVTEKSMKEIIDNNAFSESFLEIVPALGNGQWPLLLSNLTTPIQHVPTMPLTTLQLRWLKAISLDKRIKLFQADWDFLKDVEPLFVPSDYIAFDQYGDGDPYEDENYIHIFHTIVTAIKEHQKIKVEYNSAKGTHRRIMCDPVKLEYSEKDDKFRIDIASCRFATMLNVAGIESCEIIGKARFVALPEDRHSEAYFLCELSDERNALERFLLHFAHFKKEAWQTDGKQYQIKIHYDADDKTELLIRILSFGPFVKVLEPEYFVNLIKERLQMQKSCGLK